MGFVFKLSKSAVNHSQYLFANLYSFMKKDVKRFMSLIPFFEQHVLNDIIVYNQTVYLATDEGLYVAEDGGMPKLISDSIKIKCLATHENKLLVGSQTKGLLVYNMATNALNISCAYDERNRNSLSGDFVRTIFIDRKENLWISCLGNGINYTSLKRQAVRTILGGLDSLLLQSKDRYIKNIFEDGNGLLWVVSISGNIYVFDSNYQLVKRIQPNDIDAQRKPNSFQQILYLPKYGMHLLSEQGLYVESKPFTLVR